MNQLVLGSIGTLNVVHLDQSCSRILADFDGPTSVHKTAFRTQRGLFQFNRMACNLSYVDNTFQWMENSKFADLIFDGTILV